MSERNIHSIDPTIFMFIRQINIRTTINQILISKRTSTCFTSEPFASRILKYIFYESVSTWRKSRSLKFQRERERESERERERERERRKREREKEIERERKREGILTSIFYADHDFINMIPLDKSWNRF